jgi:hypothetical protein
MGRPVGALTAELDLDQFRTPAVARAGGAAMLLLGAAGLVGALNVGLISAGWLSLLGLVPLVGLAGLALLVAPFLYAGRGWAAILAVPTALGAGLAASLWTVALAIQWQLAPLLIPALLASAVASVLTPFAVRPAMRVSKIRRLLT